MDVLTETPAVPHYILPPVTTCNLDWADLSVIDLSKGNTPEGRAALTKEVRDALHTTGFFYVINHGYSPEQTRRIFDIADVPFSQVEDSEKAKYASRIKELGTYQGYKFRSFWHILNGVRDQIEQYNMHRDLTKKYHPIALRPFIPEISAFIKHNHLNIFHPLLRYIARGLELPEETLVNMHGLYAEGDTWLRFMKYYPHGEEDSKKANNLWLKGHTDFGSLSLLWSQPVSALQIRSPDGKWQWVKHVENALIVNAGDTLAILSGGYYKAAIHRVVQPPPDQQRYNRLGPFYFALADDDVRVTPIMESPLLQKVGISDDLKGENLWPGPTMEELRKARARTYGQTTLREGREGNTEEDTVAGLTVKHYL